ncbi:MAG: winged helix-turn-helix transcriptional regulator [Thermoplasmatota archaeon]
MKNDNVLGLETRRRIFEYIRDTPGAHLRQIHRAVNLPFGQVLYHLNYLEKREFIVVRKDGKFNRYFVRNVLGRREKQVISALRHTVPRKVTILLLLSGQQTHKDLLQRAGVSPSTLSFHLQKMIEAGVLSRESRGRESHYTLLDSDVVAQVLLTHRTSFHTEEVDRFAEIWERVKANDLGEVDAAEYVLPIPTRPLTIDPPTPLLPIQVQPPLATATTVDDGGGDAAFSAFESEAL